MYSRRDNKKRKGAKKMTWFILGFGTMIGCLCGATVSNMFEE
jgi:hypothetical protein